MLIALVIAVPLAILAATVFLKVIDREEPQDWETAEPLPCEFCQGKGTILVEEKDVRCPICVLEA